MPAEAKKILMANLQPLIHAGLSHYFSFYEDIDVVDVVQKPDELFDALEKHEPHVLVADYHFSGHITLQHLDQAVLRHPQTNVLVVSSDDDKESILKALELGVKGYLTTNCNQEEVMMALRLTARGEKFFSQKILDILVEQQFPKVTMNTETLVLTPREMEILKLIATGNSTQQIADDLYLSPHTVHTHRKSIIKKLNIKSPTEFVIHAIDLGIIRPK